MRETATPSVLKGESYVQFLVLHFVLFGFKVTSVVSFKGLTPDFIFQILFLS